MSDDAVVPVALAFGPYRLEAPTMADLPDVVEALQDDDISVWNAGRRHGMEIHERARLWILDRTTWTTSHASWALRDVDGRLLGQVSLHEIDHESASGQIGYWLAPWGRGRGLGTAAVATATTYAFDALGLARVELYHAVENDSSCRLALRCGYLLEGTCRQSYVYGDGARHDEHRHARLATDPAPTTTW